VGPGRPGTRRTRVLGFAIHRRRGATSGRCDRVRVSTGLRLAGRTRCSNHQGPVRLSSALAVGSSARLWGFVDGRSVGFSVEWPHETILSKEGNADDLEGALGRGALQAIFRARTLWWLDDLGRGAVCGSRSRPGKARRSGSSSGVGVVAELPSTSDDEAVALTSRGGIERSENSAVKQFAHGLPRAARRDPLVALGITFASGTYWGVVLIRGGPWMHLVMLLSTGLPLLNEDAR